MNEIEKVTNFQMFPPFPQEVFQEASSLEISNETLQGRPEVKGFTIDGPFSKDLDDAIWLEKNENGYLVSVSIADVSSLISPGSEVDSEAYSRVATRYYFTGNSPMIPRVLSEDLFSLHEEKDRPTITASIQLNKAFEIDGVTVSETSLRSQRRFSYSEFDSIIKDENHPDSQNFRKYFNVAQNLLKKRRERGALAIYDIYSGFATTEEGTVVMLRSEDRHMSNVVVQEFMILANQAVAQYFAENDTPAIFRNHTAKAISPSREVILLDIENARFSPETFDIQTVCKKVGFSLNRAFYGTKLEGHFGLNLPAYVHFTSPIRRYADLVNQRILKNLINGQGDPYSQEELEEIASHINEVENGVKEARTAAFKERAYRRAKVEIQRQANVSPENFSTMIKDTIKAKEMNFELAEVIIDRLKKGELPVKDLYKLLLESEDQTSEWLRIRQEVIAWLKLHPSAARPIVEIAMQKLNWSNLRYEDYEQGPDNALTFLSTAKVTVSQIEFVSAQFTAKTLKTSQQLATVDLLSKLAEVESLAIPDVVLVKKEEEDTQYNFKGELLELCQKRGYEQPKFNCIRSGPAHQPIFFGRAELTIKGVRVTSDEVSSTSKKELERKASENLLEKLERRGVVSSNELDQIKVVDNNYAGALQTLLLRKKWEPASYEVSEDFSAENGKFTCVLKVETDTGTVRVESKGSTIKESRKHAAKTMFRHLAG